MTTGQLIKEARKKAGMTQKQLAEKLGVSYVNISQLENNQRTPKYKTVLSIAAALSVEWTELVPAEKQGAMIVDSVIEGAGLTVTDEVGNIIRQGDGRQWRKLSDTEAHRMGFLQFNSDEDRIAFFYSHLNTDGKLAASKCFYQYLDKDKVGEVADYIERLSEIPQYQCTKVPQSPLGDTPEKPEEGE